jgi:hypothetical protein
LVVRWYSGILLRMISSLLQVSRDVAFSSLRGMRDLLFDTVADFPQS